MKSRNALFIGLGGSLLVVLSLPFIVDKILVGLYLSVWQEKFTAPIAASTYTYLSEFKKDVEILKPKVAFLNEKQTKDAGPFLNPRIKWGFSENDSKISQEYESKINKSEKFVLSNSARNILKNTKVHYFDLDPNQFTHENTDWLHKLREFNYWDIDKNGPMDLYPRSNHATPSPEFGLEYVKVHLIQAKLKNDEEFVESVLDVLNYGKLVFTTETLVGEMVFVATIGMARTVIDTRPGLLQRFGLWEPLLHEKDRLKRVYWSVNQFTRPFIGANPTTMREMYLSQNVSTGICAVVREATAIDWVLWSAATDALPDLYEEFRKLILEHPNGCRFTWLKEKTPAWVRLPNEPKSLYTSGDAFSMSNVSETVENKSLLMKVSNYAAAVVHFMPNTRKLIGTILASIGTTNFIKGYDQKPLNDLNKKPEPASKDHQ